MRKFGFHSYALDLIKTPSVIKRYLSRNYDMHNIPIGSRQVINNLQHLPDNIGVFFAGNDQIIIRTSMYTGEKITRQTQISNEAQFLIYSVDSNLIQSLTMKKEEAKVECEQFEQQLAEFMNKLKISEESRQPYFLRKKEIQGSILKFENKKNGYDRVLSDLQFTQSDLEREEKKSSTFLNQTTQIIEKYFGVMKEVVSLLDHYASSTKSVVASAFFVKHCCIDLYEENKILNQLKTLYMCNMKNFNDYQNYIQNMESEFKKMQEAALYWTRGVSPYDKNLFKPINENFEKIEQSDIEDLDSLIIEKKAKLNCLNIDSNAPQLVKEYKERKTKLKDLEKKLENLNNDAQSKEDQIEKLYTKWFPKLKELTGLLNKNFQKFITSFGCSGIIELDTGITTNDFQAYGLLIKVQFRNDYPSLRLLDSKSQSGGERALITALFLLALQEVTHFPFRIVDEINQGMDKVNERKLMELFMELFENRNDQYLVVTPKLIKNLSFKNTTVDIIISIQDEEK